jgi:DNA invertase Pin-like site-specific DNA recombinase
MADLIRIIERIEKEGASLRILAMGLNTTTPTGKLMLNV